MSVGRICVREVDIADADESVQVAAQRMQARKVGTLVVLDPHQRPLGIITDRDLATRVVAEHKDSARTSVEEVMTHPPTVIPERMSIEEALSIMRSGPFRRVPIVDDTGRLVGLLSLDDILDLLAEEFGLIRNLLREESPASLAQP